MSNTDDTYLINDEKERWHESNELFLSKLGDESQLQSICHMYSHEEFSNRSRKFQLPIIILSVISGSGNFVSSSFPDYQELIILGVGVLSIFTSIISSIAQYLKLAEKSSPFLIPCNIMGLNQQETPLEYSIGNLSFITNPLL